MKENIVNSKSYDFALEIVKLYKKLTGEKREFILSKQLNDFNSLHTKCSEIISIMVTIIKTTKSSLEKINS